MDPRYALSRSEEAKVVKECQAASLKACNGPVLAFSECAEGRTVSVAWSCRTQFREMQRCMASQMTADRIDEAKLKFLRERRQLADAGA